jgi:hypothetical protein
MRNMLWVLPAVVLFFSHRSLHNYFIFWIPVAALWLDLETFPTRHASAIEPLHEHSPPRWMTAGLVGAALVASGATGWYLASGDTIQVGSITPTLEQGMVTTLDVEVTNTGIEPIEPVFSIYWGRYTVPWDAAEPTEIGPGETERVRIVPAGRGVIPPLAKTAEGTVQPRAFRVRVSVAGESQYASSALVAPATADVPVVNSEFRYWGSPEGRLDEAPYGWSAGELSPEGSSVRIGSLGSDRGADLSARQDGPEINGWAEASLVQEVGDVSACYKLDLTYSGRYSANSEGRPLAVAGLQILQDGKSAWFVPSDSPSERITDLPEGTRIVEIPTARDTRQVVVVDLSVAGLEAGKPGTLKLFSALYGNRADAIEMRVHSIETCG